MAILLKQLSWK